MNNYPHTNLPPKKRRYVYQDIVLPNTRSNEGGTSSDANNYEGDDVETTNGSAESAKLNMRRKEERNEGAIRNETDENSFCDLEDKEDICLQDETGGNKEGGGCDNRSGSKYDRDPYLMEENTVQGNMCVGSSSGGDEDQQKIQGRKHATRNVFNDFICNKDPCSRGKQEQQKSEDTKQNVTGHIFISSKCDKDFHFCGEETQGSNSDAAGSSFKCDEHPYLPGEKEQKKGNNSKRGSTETSSSGLLIKNELNSEPEAGPSPRRIQKLPYRSKNFAHESILRIYRRVHTEEKLYKCKDKKRNSTATMFKSFKVDKDSKSEEREYKGQHKKRSGVECKFEYDKDSQLPDEQEGKGQINNNDVARGSSNGSVAENEVDPQPLLGPSSQEIHRFQYCGEALKMRLRVQSEKEPYQCEKCGKLFKWFSRLTSHQITHTGNKPYNCKECGKSFARSSNLTTHQFLHSGEKPYKCQECGISFARSSNLNTHQFLHSGEKPYKCQECGKSFARSRDLIRHQFLHSGKKPYKCEVCFKAFGRKDKLDQHRKTHRN